jgi:hypothetical protein
MFSVIPADKIFCYWVVMQVFSVVGLFSVFLGFTSFRRNYIYPVIDGPDSHSSSFQIDIASVDRTGNWVLCESGRWG